MSLKFYYDSLSQPCRAVEIFLKINKIPYEPKPLKIAEGHLKTKEFAAVNPFKKVPAIEYNGKPLTESIAILRFLCREFNVPDYWYPKDSFQQAKVDEYLEWHHLGTRYAVYSYVWAKTLDSLFGRKRSPEEIQAIKKNLSRTLDTVNNIWLKNKAFMTGPTISIADILAATEIDQLVMTDFVPHENRPALAAWLERVRKHTNPFYDELQQQVVDFTKLILGPTSKL